MAQDTAQKAAVAPATPARGLLPLTLPALVAGFGASLLGLAMSGPATQLRQVLWGNLPDAVGVGRYSAPRILVVITATGVLAGPLVWKAPGVNGRRRTRPK
ncbi:hypothetical protein [Streptomyces sp. NPDC093261]|uniref:hypothetical protein n=1 Tax=Streptomyces sp. NPDC093261 TaxID=3366037 RepID=UPI0038112398